MADRSAAQSPARQVVLATHNEHKVDEFRRMLVPAIDGIEVRSYDGPEPVESGVTFAENALIKARAAVEHTGRAAFADDSGLAVDVLGGAPGIFSARWSGRHGDSAANLALLLDQLADVPDAQRAARFVCAIAYVEPGGRHFVVHGEWHGMLARAPRGTHGFGYDPAFVPDGDTRTAAELEPKEKDAISHRARAMHALIEALRA